MKQALLFVLFAFVLLCAAAIAHLSGPPPACTGAPGEGTCANAGCHDSYAPNPTGGVVAIGRCATDIPYVGMTVAVPITVYSPGALKWGYELTALDGSGNPAGQLIVIDSLSQITVGGDGRPYASQTVAGTGENNWVVHWEAPDTSVGVVYLYVSAVAANGDSTPSGDRVFTYIHQLAPDYFPEYCLVNPTGDVNENYVITSADIIYLVNYVFRGGPAPLACLFIGDVNCSGSINSADIIYLVMHVFRGGWGPCNACCGSPLPCGA